MSNPPDRMKRIFAAIPMIASLLFPDLGLAATSPESPTPLNAPADSMTQWRAFIEFREIMIANPELRQALFTDPRTTGPILEQRIYRRLIADGLPPDVAAAQTQQVSVVLHEIAALSPADRLELYDYIQDHPIEQASSAVIGVVSVIAVALAVKVAIAVQSANAIQAANVFVNANALVNVNVLGGPSDGAGESNDDASEADAGDVGETGGGTEGGSFIDWDTFGEFESSDGGHDSFDGGEFEGGGDDVIIDEPIGANSYVTEPGVVVEPTVLASLQASLGQLSDHRARTLLRRILSSKDSVAIAVSQRGGRRQMVYEYRSKQLEVTARLDRRRNLFHVLDVKIV